MVLYGFETWSLALREQHKLRVFEDRVLRRIFGPRRDEVIREWRKLHNEELHDLYSSPSTIRIIRARRMRWAGHVARMGKREMHTGYWWEIQRERDHSEDKDVSRWIILIDILEIGWGVVDWIGLAQDKDK
jgi:hypothetical protein